MERWLAAILAADVVGYALQLPIVTLILPQGLPGKLDTSHYDQMSVSADSMRRAAGRGGGL
jgi:hypothetical protein